MKKRLSIVSFAVSEDSGDFINGIWGYDADGAMCLEDQYFDYSDAIEDLSGLQNTLNLSSHTHMRTFGGSSSLDKTAATKAMKYPIDAPVGTSGWFLGSMGQWDIFLKEFCHIQASEIPDLDPDTNFPDDEYKAQLCAASCENAGTIQSMGDPFVRAGYANPFVSLYYKSHDGAFTVGFTTSTEIDFKRAWVVSVEFDNDVDGEDYEDVEADVSVSFLRYTKGQGQTILPFLAF